MVALLTDKDFELFSKIIYEESGITFSSANRSILDSRIKERLRETKLPDAESYYRLICSNSDEMKTMLDAVTTNLTRFFRNQPHFDALVHYVIPKIIEKKKAAHQTVVRVWSAGCSTGEEPYSIAMILKEYLPANFTPEVIASDLSLKSLMTGKQGFYLESRINGVPDNYLTKFFTKIENGYQIKDEIKNFVRFDYHNLKNDSGQKDLDIIFCRNVLIYFDEAAQKAVVNKFWNSMGPNSYLFIGHSESLFGMNTKFEFLKTDWACLYEKKL